MIANGDIKCEDDIRNVREKTGVNGSLKSFGTFFGKFFSTASQ